jgi:predicted MFS family arabinose efflux permease
MLGVARGHRVALGAHTSAQSTAESRERRRERLPRAVTVSDHPVSEARFPWLGLTVLAAAVFLSVTGETLPTGLLPDMSSDLHVGEPAVGLLVTVFAFTVVLTSTPLAHFTRRFARRRIVVAVLVVLALSNVLTALAPNYPLVLSTRIVGGIAHGLFWAVVGAYAGHLVPREQIARAVSITLGGGTLAFVFGVPLATAAGHAFGWRLSFAGVGVLMLLGALLVWRFLPHTERADPDEEQTAGGGERTLVPVVLVSVVAAVVIVGHYTFYTYIAPFLIGPMGVGSAAVAPLLFGYGIAGAAGLLLAGSVLGRRPTRSLVIGLVVTGAAVAALALLAAVPVLGIAALLLWGIAFGTLPPLMQTRLLHASSARFRDTASALYTTAFNIGIGGGALLGATLFGPLGVGGLPWVYVALLALALVLLVVSVRLRLGSSARRR